MSYKEQHSNFWQFPETSTEILRDEKHIEKPSTKIFDTRYLGTNNFEKSQKKIGILNVVYSKMETRITKIYKYGRNSLHFHGKLRNSLSWLRNLNTYYSRQAKKSRKYLVLKNYTISYKTIPNVLDIMTDLLGIYNDMIET